MRNNDIEEIKPGTFAGLQRLEWLFLEDNRLTSFPFDDLSGLSSLRWLNLSGNLLRLDKGESFPELGHLWDL